MLHGCQACQALMLEYLYDLLDSGEREAVEAHLADCPVCPPALRRAQQGQQLLAAAARLEFPGVRFTAPEEEDVLTPVPTPTAGGAPTAPPATLPLPARRRRTMGLAPLPDTGSRRRDLRQRRPRRGDLDAGARRQNLPVSRRPV